jgi:hypothetical protein
MTEMASIDHTNPFTDEPFAATFRRGVVVVADGGERGAGREDQVTPTDEATATDGVTPTNDGGPSGDRRPSRDSRRDVAEEEMEDVEHESPTDGAVRSFERGTEGRDRTV